LRYSIAKTNEEAGSMISRSMVLLAAVISSRGTGARGRRIQGYNAAELAVLHSTGQTAYTPAESPR